jgi:two-component system chemotaxis response regulator CheB
MYESLMESSYREITCVVLTGMGADGTKGIEKLATKRNLYVIAQDAESCVVYGMPKVAYDMGAVEHQERLQDIAKKTYLLLSRM